MKLHMELSTEEYRDLLEGLAIAHSVCLGLGRILPKGPVEEMQFKFAERLNKLIRLLADSSIP